MAVGSPPPDVRGAVEWYLTVQCKADGLSPATINEAYGHPLRRILVPFCEHTTSSWSSS